ncbi:MAG: arsinothricin resistance N-acetyltransferase ArsN1 [Candidatus Abyssubacteria bacterium]
MEKSASLGPSLKGLRVREAVLHDIQRITEIHNQGIVDRESVLDITPYPLNQRLVWFKNLSEREAVIVAEVNGCVVGFSALQPYSHDDVYAHVGVATVWVEKDFRGRGIGRSLARKTFSTAKKRGYRKLMFFAYCFNREKMGFYRKLGYEEVGIFKRHAKIGKRLADVLAMEYHL